MDFFQNELKMIQAAIPSLNKYSISVVKYHIKSNFSDNFVLSTDPSVTIAQWLVSAEG